MRSLFLLTLLVSPGEGEGYGMIECLSPGPNATDVILTGDNQVRNSSQVLELGDGCTTNRSLTSADTLVCGALEVNGGIFSDGALSVASQVRTTFGGSTVFTPEAPTCADSGDGNPGTCTLSNADVASAFRITCNDADGCALTLDETTVVSGMEIWITNISASNVITIADSAGVQETTGALSLGPNDNVRFRHNGTAWLQSGPVMDL